VPVPGLDLLRYRVPDGLPAPPKGARVMVPVGHRTLLGCVVDADAAPPEGARLRDLSQILDREPFLPPGIVDLALWVGDYYASGPGDALAIAMPPLARQGRASAFRTTKRAELVEAPPSGVVVKGAKQQAALEILRATPGATLQVLAQQGVSTATVRSLVTRGLLRLHDETVLRDPFDDESGAGGTWTLPVAAAGERTLTAEQAGAVSTLSDMAAAGAFRVGLLHGVTGSGKTEIYLHLAERVLAAGRRVLILVPEIALTPSVAGQVRQRFGSRVAIQHSALGPGERHDQWQRIRRGDVDIVVGTRSSASVSSSSTRSTMARTSKRKRRGITAATSRWCAAGWKARSWCSGARRRRSSRRPTQSLGVTIWSSSRAGSWIGRWRRSRSSTCAVSTRPSDPTLR
jgi:primosomal protein N' (replication factor Y)